MPSLYITNATTLYSIYSPSQSLPSTALYIISTNPKTRPDRRVCVCVCVLVDSKCIDNVLKCSTGIWGFYHLVQDVEGGLGVGLAQVLGCLYPMAAHHQLVDLEERGKDENVIQLTRREFRKEAMKMWINLLEEHLARMRWKRE